MPGPGEPEQKSNLSPIRGVSGAAVVLSLASSQHGVVSRTQLVDNGLSKRMVDAQVQALRLVPVYRGVYGVGRGVINRKGRWRAALLAGGDGSALARRTAAEAWGFGRETRVLELVRDFNRRPRDFPLERNVDGAPKRLTVHRTRTLPASDLATVDGFPVTSVARTLLDLASASSDQIMDRYLSEASRLDLLDLDAIREACGRGKGWRGTRVLRSAIDRIAPGSSITKSELESMFLRLCANENLPMPEVNVKLRDSEVDCLWRNERLIIELDGYAFHRGQVSFERDHGRDFGQHEARFRTVRITHLMLINESARIASFLRSYLGR